MIWPFLISKTAFLRFSSFILLSPQWPPCCFSTTPGLLQFRDIVFCLKCFALGFLLVHSLPLYSYLFPNVTSGSFSASSILKQSFIFLILPFEIISYIKSYSIFKGCFSITRQAQSRTFVCVCVC